MKAKIKVIIRDEQENVIGQLNPEKIDLGHQSLHEIEGAVDLGACKDQRGLDDPYHLSVIKSHAGVVDSADRKIVIRSSVETQGK